jgi:cell division protein FtsB
MNLPSRKQVTDLASQLMSLEARLEALEERIEDLVDGIGFLKAFVKRAGDPQPAPPPQE